MVLSVQDFSQTITFLQILSKCILSTPTKNRNAFSKNCLSQRHCSIHYQTISTSMVPVVGMRLKMLALVAGVGLAFVMDESSTAATISENEEVRQQLKEMWSWYQPNSEKLMSILATFDKVQYTFQLYVGYQVVCIDCAQSHRMQTSNKVYHITRDYTILRQFCVYFWHHSHFFFYTISALM